MDNNRGSQFRRWDLHYHSHKTVLNNQFEQDNDYEQYFEDLEKSDICAYGITDYFKFDNIEETIAIFKEKYPRSKKVLFPNIEFRLNQNLSNNSAGHVNFHLIFDPSVDFLQVKRFINLLELTQTQSNGSKKQIVDLNSESDFYSATIKLEEIENKLKTVFGNEKPYLKVFSANGLGGIRPNITNDSGSHRNGVLSDEYEKKADFLFSNIQSRDYYLNERESRYEGSIPKACILASDFHGDNSQNQLDKFSWIKADVTFEGLKQITFEPKDRVFLGAEKPCLEKDELVIDSFEYLDKTFYLSENLNSIIGGRGTGKSTLLNSFAKKLGVKNDVHSLPIDKFKIVWRDNKENNQRQIQYIPQDYMFTLANEEKKLNELVKDIIKSKKLDTEIETYNIECTNVKFDIQDLLFNYFNTEEKLESLHSPEAEEEATHNRIEEYKLSRQKILSKTDFNETEKQQFQDFQKFKREIEKQINEDVNQQQIINNLNIQEFRIVNYDEGLSEEIKEKIEEISRTINEDIKQKLKLEIGQISFLLNNRITTNYSELSKVEQNGIYQKGIAISQTDKELQKIEKLLIAEESILEGILNYNKKKEQLEYEIKRLKDQIIEKYKKYKHLRESLEDKFNIEEIDLEIKLEFKQKDFYDEFTYVNGQGTIKSKFIEKLQNDFDGEIENIFDQSELKFNGNKTTNDLIENFFTTHFYDFDFKIIYQNDEFQEMSPGKKSFVILKLILEFSDSKIPVLIDQPEDSLDNRAIYNELTKYIKETKLKRQIIIATHNPNVVVGSDCENIIVANQNSKNSKNRDNIQFDYINGGLEHSLVNQSSFVLEKQGIREHIFEILEGGREAFEKREKKYNLKRM